MNDYLACLLSDKMMFWILQLSLISLVIVSIFKKSNINRGSVSISIDRGEGSMAIFYGAYITISGLLVSICLSVEFIKDYQIIWIVIDVSIAAYICIFNTWSRNKLIGISMKIKKLES